jgi:hypothetical protein
MSEVISETDPALQEIWEKLNKLSAVQDKLMAYPQDHEKDVSASQDKLVEELTHQRGVRSAEHGAP